jgi:hypothetical protein
MVLNYLKLLQVIMPVNLNKLKKGYFLVKNIDYGLVKGVSISMNGDLTKYREIFNLEKLLINPKIRKSKDTINMIVSEDFIEFGSSGSIYKKEAIVNGLLNENVTKISEFRVRQLDNYVIQATYVVEELDDKSGKAKSSLRSSIWRFIDDNWQIIFHQGTNIA